MRAVEAHLGECDGCLADALAMSRVTARLDAGPSLAVPATLRERVASRWASAPVEESLTALVVRVARAGVALVERHVVAPILDVEALPLAAAATRAARPPTASRSASARRKRRSAGRSSRRTAPSA
jgi:hypothetical protein